LITEKLLADQVTTMGSATECIEEEAVPSTLRFEDVYEAHFPFVWRMTRRLGVEDAGVDDVVQEVFLVLHRRIAEYDGRASVRGWLFGILSRVVRDHRRRRARKDAPCVPVPRDSSDDLTLPSSDPTPSALAERSERIALLQRVLERLDDAKREILVLAFLEEMTVPEIAELLDVNLNTAYSRLRAAKQAFAEEHARITRNDP
jgi:RNA polymerase sigma-70 factor (ECF subfamily)